MMITVKQLRPEEVLIALNAAKGLHACPHFPKYLLPWHAMSSHECCKVPGVKIFVFAVIHVDLSVSINKI